MNYETHQAKQNWSEVILMELKDLRIGNYLLYDGGYVYVTLLSMDIDDEYQEIIGFCKYGESTNEMSNFNTALCDKLEPIHLTPEILEKCGFERIGEKPFYSCRLSLNSVDELAWYSLDNKLGYQTKGSGFTRDYQIKHLHQLQNLHFALTGEELKIEL